MLKYCPIILIFSILAFLGYGQWLDKEALEADLAMYERGDNNVIKGTDQFKHKANHKKAVILVHGFMSNPTVYKPLFKKLKNLNQFDIYVPLLPFHSRRISDMKNMDNKIIGDYLHQKIKTIAERYEEIVIVGFSYGGAQLVNLSFDKQLPENSRLIFLSPAYFIKTNNFIGDIIATTYGSWRNYCRSSIIGCGKGMDGQIKSADKYGNQYLMKNHKQLAYDVLPAIKALYDFDQTNNHKIIKLTTPHTILMAKDDVLLDFKEIKSHCMKNLKCKFISYDKGNHYFLVGQFKEQVEKKLVKLISNKSNN